MKIALNIEWIGAKRGGAEKYAGTVARALIEAGHDVHLFARGVDDGEVPPHVPIHEINVFTAPGFGWLHTHRFAAASECILSNESFDLVIGFNKTWYQDVYLAVAGARPASNEYSLARFRNPLRRTLHRLGKLVSPKHWLFRQIERRQFVEHAPHVVACSRFSARHFHDYHNVPPERISVVHNGLDVDRAEGDRAALRAQFRTAHDLKDGDVALLFTARNYELKGLEPLIESFARVAAKSPRAVLVVCGSRRDQKFRRLAARRGIAERVRFLGFVDDVRAPFAGCDVFAFPSFYDPCSLVVPEALHAGLPVITSGTNGAGELIVDGTTGYVVAEAWDVDAWSDRLARLVEDTALRKRMSAAAREHAETMTMSTRLEELLAVLHRVRNAHSTAAIQQARAA